MNSGIPSGNVVTPDEPQSAPEAPVGRPPAQMPYPTYPPAPGDYPYPGPRQPQEPPRTHWGAWMIGGVVGAVVVACMAVALVVAIVAGVLFSAVAGPEATATTTRAFAVTGTPSLVVTNSAGNITVRVGSGNQVTAQVTSRVRARTSSIARAGANNTAVNLNQNGNAISVSAQFTTTYFDGGTAHRTVDMLLTVPAGTNIDANLGAGNINVRDITGAIRLEVGAGNLTVTNVTFSGSSRLHTGAGNVTANAAMASSAVTDIDVGAGNATVTLPADTPAHLTASTGVGNLTISGWPISVSQTSVVGRRASGDLNASPTATLTINVGTGNLTVRSR